MPPQSVLIVRKLSWCTCCSKLNGLDSTKCRGFRCYETCADTAATTVGPAETPAKAAQLGPVAREGDLERARELLASAVGDGPVSTPAGSEQTTTLLAPYLAFAGLVLVLVLVFGLPRLPGRRATRTMVEA